MYKYVYYIYDNRAHELGLSSFYDPVRIYLTDKIETFTTSERKQYSISVSSDSV